MNLTIPAILAAVFFYCGTIFADTDAKDMEKQPKLGMDISVFKQQWGAGTPSSGFDIERRDGPDDKDYLLYKGLNKHCKGIKWVLDKGEEITGIFLNDKCIGFEISLPERSEKEAVKFASNLLSGYKFSNRNFRKDCLLVTYSTDSEKSYKLQYWDDCFDVKDLKRMRLRLTELNLPITESDREREKRINQEIESIIAETMKAELTGKSLDELTSIMSPKKADESSWSPLPGKKVGWTFDSIRINVCFNENVCYAFVIQSKEELYPSQALELAQAFTPGYRFESRNSKDNKTLFKIMNMGVNKKYMATWNYDQRLKVFTLHVVDVKLSKKLNKGKD